MSSTSDLVYKNFIWRIENITPTYGGGLKKFTFNPVLRGGLNPDQSSGMTRDFVLYWDSAGPVDEPNSGVGRQRDYYFTVEVCYTTDFKLSTLCDIVLKDSFDLTKTLRDDSKWTGYDSSNSSTTINLWARFIEEEILDRGSAVSWYLRQKWKCVIWEDEY